MKSRLFLRTKKQKFSFLKRVFATLTLIAIFLGNFNFASAGAIDDLNATYKNYLNLFEPTSTLSTDLLGNGTTQPKKSGLLYQGPLVKNNVVDGFVFNIALVFDTAAKPIEWHWDRVSNSGNFLVRVCKQGGTAADCLTGHIPFEAVSDNRSFIASRDAAGGFIKAQGVVYDFGHGGALYKYTTKETTNSVTFANGGNFTADLWYCAGPSDSDPKEDGTDNTIPKKYTDAGATDPSAQIFGSECGGTTFFRIGTPIQITLSSDATVNQNAANDSERNARSNTIDKNPSSSGTDLPECGILTTSKLMGCVAVFTYYVIFKPISWIAGIFGSLFDFFIGYSVSDESYRFAFAVTGWKLVRDIANIFFIVILVWVGFSAIFNFSGNNSMKKVIPTLIINAIIINFSLFATRLVIDLSNVTARIFYSRIYVCEGECQRDDKGNITNYRRSAAGGYWPLSEKIISAFNPQRILNADVLKNKNVECQRTEGDTFDAQNNDACGQSLKGENDSDNNYAAYFVLVCLIAAVIMFAVAKMFWSVAFIFLGRVIGLYLCMIFSPFAFLSREKMPIIGKVADLSWDGWLGELTKYATLAPLFTFFLYIIFSFLNTDFVSNLQINQSGHGFVETVLTIGIPMLIIYMLIEKGADIAKTYSGKMGAIVQSWGQKVGGIATGSALGLATGGAAFLGRNAVGRGLRLIGNGGKRTDEAGNTTTRAERWAANANNSWFGRQWNNAFSKTQTGSWDARNTKLGNLTKDVGGFLGSQLKTNFSDKVSGSIYGLGENAGKGGVVAINKKLADKKQKLLEERIDMSHLSDEQAKNAAAAYKAKRAEKESNKIWEEHVDSVAALKTEKDVLDKAAETLESAKKALEEARTKNDGTAAGNLKVSRAEQKVKDAETDHTTASTAFAAAKATVIKDIKEGKADKIKEEATGIAKAAVEKRLAEYKVKDAASFRNMMRAEYVNDLQNTSFMKKLLEGINLTDPKAMFGAIAGTALGILIPPLTPMIVSAMGVAIGKEMTDEAVYTATGSTSKAIKAINKKAKTKTGGGNVLVDMEARLESLKETAKKAVEESFGKTFDSFEKISEKDLEEGILNHVADLQGSVEDLNDKIKARSGTPDEIKEARRERARILDKLEKLKNIQDKIARQQKDIDEHKQKESDKKKKDEEDKSKKK